jgi:flagellar basal-body rod modification protein FlgD
MNVNDSANYAQSYSQDNRSGSGISANTSSASGMNDMFLKLLVAQIQNQDPLNPTDGTEYVGQLAQLSQVQSMERVASLTQNNAILMDNLQTLTTASLVGKNVMVQTDKIALDGKTAMEGRLTLEHPASSVTVRVTDAMGNEQKIELGNQASGAVDFTLDPQKLGLTAGNYTLSVVTDVDEKNIPVEMGGKVGKVRIPLQGGGPVLSIAGLGDVPFSKISQFG